MQQHSFKKNSVKQSFVDLRREKTNFESTSLGKFLSVLNKDDSRFFRRVFDFLIPLYQKESPDNVWLSTFSPSIDIASILLDLQLARNPRATSKPGSPQQVTKKQTLDQVKIDTEVIAAALLFHSVELSVCSIATIRDSFGPAVASLVIGIGKINAFELNPKHHAEAHRAQAEVLRKMLLTMADDVRVVLIKLAQRAHEMRELKCEPKNVQKLFSTETIEIYAPLANRLGIWQLKWELEDRAFSFINPTEYKKMAALLDEKRVSRQHYIEDFIKSLNAELDKTGFDTEISGRPKHLYSIWKKMHRKGVEYNEIYDVRGIRVLTTKVQDCYAVLGVVHALWRYIPGEFDDYITSPKDNNYQSIHTAVIGPQGKVIEIQIRTFEMHQDNELGIAAHWRYKEGGVKDQGLNDKIAWLRQLLEWKDEITASNDSEESFKNDAFEERIYVLTPQGRIVDLPKGATPVDFAYHIHTEVGHKCRGAKVDGKMVSLTFPLKTGHSVEILTVKNAAPSRDWLNVHQGYINTTRARNKVQTWFRQQDHDQNIVDGRKIFERELKRLGLSNINQEKIAQQFKMSSVDDFFAAITRNDIKSTQYLKAIQQFVENKQLLPEQSFIRKPSRKRSSRFEIKGVGNLMTVIANCCKPVPGDSIMGYITRGRGISVHRSDCRNILRNHKEALERIVEVTWGAQDESVYEVDISVSALDRSGLLHDIAAILSNDKINVIATETHSNHENNHADMMLRLEVTNLEKFSLALTKICQLPNVLEAKRITN